MKKVYASMCVLLMILVIISPVSVIATASECHENMTSEEVASFLRNSNIVIPSYFEKEADGIEFAKLILQELSKDRNAIFTFGYVGYQAFANEIRAAYIASDTSVIPNNTNAVTSTTSAIDQLQYNTFYSYPSNANVFNCYGYAVDEVDWLIIGGEGDDGWKPATTTVGEAAEMIREDIGHLDYCIKGVYTSLPIDDVNDESKNVICFRQTSFTGLLSGYNDFHFMKVVHENGNVKWRHKPGSSAILTYNTAPNTGSWVQEAIGKNASGEFEYHQSNLYIYDSVIYYFVYTNHNYIETLIRNYHGIGTNKFSHYYVYRATCQDCGKVKEFTRVLFCNKDCITPLESKGDVKQ